MVEPKIKINFLRRALSRKPKYLVINAHNIVVKYRLDTERFIQIIYAGKNPKIVKWNFSTKQHVWEARLLRFFSVKVWMNLAVKYADQYRVGEKISNCCLAHGVCLDFSVPSWRETAAPKIDSQAFSMFVRLTRLYNMLFYLLLGGERCVWYKWFLFVHWLRCRVTMINCHFSYKLFVAPRPNVTRNRQQNFSHLPSSFTRDILRDDTPQAR